MHSKLLEYWRTNHRAVIVMTVLFAAAWSLPPFRLFGENSSNLVQVHLLLELFAVIVAILIVTVSWEDMRKNSSPESGVLMAGFALVAVFDLVHALSYDGMPNFISANSAAKSIYFWLWGRSFVVLTLLLVALRLTPALSRRTWLELAAGIAVIVVSMGVFQLNLFPATFIPGSGVTVFKRNFEYALFASDLVLALIFILRATPDNQRRSFAVATSCLTMAFGEIIFSNYKTPSDFLNSFGHIFKVVSYALLYRYIFASAIRLPYEQARQSAARFRALTALSAEGYWEQDAQYRFTEVIRRHAAYPERSMLGRTRWELPTAGINPAQWREHRQKLDRREEFRDFVYQVESPPGTFRWHCTSGTPIFGEDGQFQGYRGTVTDITESVAAKKQIEFLAYHDPLTGLPNRLLLEDRFEQSTALAKRNGTKVAMLFLDLDNFKSINDTLGHDAGDALLKEVAHRLADLVRPTDTISRQGGDEFVLLVPNLSDVDELMPALTKILESLEEAFHADGHDISTSTSIGVVIYPDDGRDFETLRKKADMAMYRAKDAGRNSYRFFDETMNLEAREHLTMRNGLRRAVERNEFVLHYQPQIDLISGAVTGAEALIRWNHPDLGLVLPGRFISVAEESGMIVAIGDWVMREACQQSVSWQRGGLPPFTLAVNLSAVQFKRGNVEQSVLRALDESGLDPSLLELELTESLLIQNVDNVLDGVKRLKQLGVKLSIDDFGTGYSSLSYLKRFDIDKLKIDQSFVRDLATDPEDAAIVSAIIQMAHSLNLKAIAEGVETSGMLSQLRAFHCDEAQGYHFARPMPAPEFEAYLRDACATARTGVA